MIFKWQFSLILANFHLLADNLLVKLSSKIFLDLSQITQIAEFLQNNIALLKK